MVWHLNALNGSRILSSLSLALSSLESAIHLGGKSRALGDWSMGSSNSSNSSPVGLEKGGGPQVLVRVPPVRGAGRRAAGAEDTLVEAVLTEAQYEHRQECHYSRLN